MLAATIAISLAYVIGCFHYGASEASAVFRRLTEISEHERPAGGPAWVTRLRGSYLSDSNHLTDLHAQFL